MGITPNDYFLTNQGYVFAIFYFPLRLKPGIISKKHGIFYAVSEKIHPDICPKNGVYQRFFCDKFMVLPYFLKHNL